MSEELLDSSFELRVLELEEDRHVHHQVALPRRTFLHGMGAALALPLLDAMVPALTALAQTAANPVRRLGFVYIPMGMNAAAWTPIVVWPDH